MLRGVVRRVELQQVDAIGAEPAQASLRGGDDRRSARAFRELAAVAHPELGGDDDVVAPIAEGPSEQFLAAAFAVHVGGVEQRDASVDGRIDHRLGGLVVHAPAEVVATEPDQRDRQAPDGAGLHAGTLRDATVREQAAANSRAAGRGKGIAPTRR